ncbi:unnamed protein product [Urochloa decumbens]|uniref:Uncharacterized protein n=1 Tax=Urochloa decumbens TaxID=240449 RepID=A0ABC9BCA5_9POAL
MGNCQAAEAAAVVIQHPGGKVERLYGAATAGEVMRSNPGHYVALVVLRVSGVGGGGGGGVKITKVKLLKPKDALLLGQVYRLITSQEVAKAIQARRQDKTRRCGEEAPDDRRRPGHAAGGEARGQSGGAEQVSALRISGSEIAIPESSRLSVADSASLFVHQERKRAEKADRQHRSGGSGGGARGGRHWRPSLQSINESAS